VRIEGRVAAVSPAEADVYWETRPRQSRIAARTSRQSRAIASHAELMSRWHARERELRGEEIPRPSYWNGFRIVPRSIEFWTRRPFRLHERVLFVRAKEGWRRSILQP
jgi:pyridoxamine 5'-phosphate oxidase